MPTSKSTTTAAAEDKPEVSGFDLTAWLGEASRPERSVTLFAANALQADIDRLERERAEVEERAQEEGAAGSWGDHGMDIDARIDALNEQIGAARKKLAASGQEFRVRSLDTDDLDRINREHPFPKDGDDDEKNRVMNDRYLAQMSEAVVFPRKLTPEELVELRKACGDAEFMKLFAATMDCMSENAASTPFWRGNSGTSRN